MEFGKKVRVRNFYMVKYSKSLSGKDARRLRAQAGIPEEVQRSLSRGTLPFIRVSSGAEVWSVEFAAGSSMYNALDAVTVVHDGDGVCQLYGVEERNVFAMFVAMYADTTTLGDEEYNRGKQKLLSEYVERVTAARVESDREGKSEELQRRESDEAMEEVSAAEHYGEMLTGMARDVFGKGEGGGHD